MCKRFLELDNIIKVETLEFETLIIFVKHKILIEQ